jgi:hypothetical protein
MLSCFKNRKARRCQEESIEQRSQSQASIVEKIASAMRIAKHRQITTKPGR